MITRPNSLNTRRQACARLAGASSAALALAILLPSPVSAQAAQTPLVTSPGTPVQTDPSPAQTAIAPTTSPVAPPGGDAAASTISEGAAQDIVVTGFRRSLDAALNVKRESVSAVDAIVAEDIAKFPDQNLAESLQRIPGISIQRDAGEGRAITVRGLGAQFTRVRVNGLETVATSTDGASANRDRAFDFNVFASELFNSIVVHKTAEASLDEGSLGAVVDLNTGNPLAGKSGFTFVGSGQASYNDLSKNFGPRLAGLVSWKNPEGTFGASVSGAYSKTNNLELGNNTVRWAQARFDSVGGTPCFFSSATSATRSANTGGVYRSSTACDQASLSFHPRIPRYSYIRHDRERLGITGSVQWSPSDATKVSIDGLFSRFRETREEKDGEVLLRSNERSIDVINPVYDANNNMISATLNDAWVRTEHYLRKSETKFWQIGTSWDQDVTDRLRFTALGGMSKSDASIPMETTLILDDRDAQNYQYDYTNMTSPKLTFGTSVTDPANFQLAEIRDRPSSTVNRFRTAQFRAEWDAVPDQFTVKVGGVYRRFEFDSQAFLRDTTICPTVATATNVTFNGHALTCTPSSVFGPTAVYGYPASGLTETFNIGKAGQPSGTTTDFVIADIGKAADYTGLYSRPLLPDVGNIRNVIEETSGTYLQIDFKGEILGLRYSANAGMRYAHTHQESTGLSNGLAVTIKRNYDDWLPAVNLALFPTEKLIIRAAAADVMTRPSLANLTPGGSVDGFNYTVSFGNPQLEPFRAHSYDLSAEWYFAPQSIFSVALFKKDVQSFPVSVTTSGTFASTGLPLSVIAASSPAASNPEGRIWQISTITNGSGASLKGAEIALQLPFQFLPGVLKNFGVLANATFIKSSATYTQSGPSIVPGGALISVARASTLYGVSKRSYNATLYYEDKKFSARASIAYRGPYVDAGSGTGNIFEGYNSTINVDASVRYKITENLEVSLEGTNLTDEYRDRYTDLDANRNYEYNHFGRTFLLGARIKM